VVYELRGDRLQNQVVIFALNCQAGSGPDAQLLPQRDRDDDLALGANHGKDCAHMAYIVSVVGQAPSNFTFQTGYYARVVRLP